MKSVDILKERKNEKRRECHTITGGEGLFPH